MIHFIDRGTPFHTKGMRLPESEFRLVTDKSIRLIEHLLGNGIVLNEFQRHYLKTGVWLGDWLGPKRQQGKTTAVILRYILSKGEPLPLDLLTDEPHLDSRYARAYFQKEFRRVRELLRGVMPVREIYDYHKPRGNQPC